MPDDKCVVQSNCRLICASMLACTSNCLIYHMRLADPPTGQCTVRLVQTKSSFFPQKSKQLQTSVSLAINFYHKYFQKIKFVLRWIGRKCGPGEVKRFRSFWLPVQNLKILSGQVLLSVNITTPSFRFWANWAPDNRALDSWGGQFATF